MPVQILGLQSPVSVTTTIGRPWQSRASRMDELEMTVTSHSRCSELSVQLINVPALRADLLDIKLEKPSVFICLIMETFKSVREGGQEPIDLLMFS